MSNKKKHDKDLMNLDIYELLGVPTDAEEQLIRKSYRKKAKSCHPDKNPDKPDAAAEFDKLKKVLEILLDPGARSAYDRLLKSRKAAAIRAREANAVTQKLKSDLERREKEAASTRPTISEEERFRRELKRLEEEGEQLIAEELEKVNIEVEEGIKSAYGISTSNAFAPEANEKSFKIKVKWVSTDDWPGYTKDEIQQLFYKWGEINAIVVNQKDSKGTALVDYQTQSGADMAVNYEKGMPEKPVVVSHLKLKRSENGVKKSSKNRPPHLATKSTRDFESIADMNNRRQEERRKLIEQMNEKL